MPDTDRTWIVLWNDAIADGAASMSQRRLSSVERNGGVAAAVAAAKARGVHLAKRTDEKGNVLVAASLHPFEALC